MKLTCLYQYKLVPTSSNSSREALNVRNLFKEYFISNEGRVQWQQGIVNRTA